MKPRFSRTRYCRVLYSYLKPESVRVHPEATVRPWATVQVVGDALSFASALGYVYVPVFTLVVVMVTRLHQTKISNLQTGLRLPERTADNSDVPARKCAFCLLNKINHTSQNRMR